MKNPLFLLSLFLLIGACSNTETSSQANANESAEETPEKSEVSNEEIAELVIGLEKENLDGWSSGEAGNYVKHYAKDATYMDDIGAQHRLEGADSIRAHITRLGVPAHNYEMINPKVQVFDNTAALTFQYHPTLPDGTPGSKWKATIVYVLLDDGWKAVHGNWSFLEKK